MRWCAPCTLWKNFYKYSLTCSSLSLSLFLFLLSRSLSLFWYTSCLLYMTCANIIFVTKLVYLTSWPNTSGPLSFRPIIGKHQCQLLQDYITDFSKTLQRWQKWLGHWVNSMRMDREGKKVRRRRRSLSLSFSFSESTVPPCQWKLQQGFWAGNFRIHLWTMK